MLRLSYHPLRIGSNSVIRIVLGSHMKKASSGAGEDASEPAPPVVFLVPYPVTLEQLTALVRAARVLRMGRLSDTLAKATNARLALETAVEADVKKYIDRVQSVDKTRETVFFEKHSELDGHVSDLSEFKEDLEAFGKNDQSGDGSKTGDAYTGTRKPV